jgi:8-oxo-dGTP pyrophosphatase MutT (NUDIX family)
MDSFELIQQIRKSMDKGLPGIEAQYRMAPPARRRAFLPNHKSREAAVLLTLYPKMNEWHVVFIERASAIGHDRHRGQISLPGGKRDFEDGSFEETALREAKEEVGINAADVRVIGPLSELFIPVSDFHVFPYVGYLDYTPSFTPQVEEVADILEVPLNHFENENIRKTMYMELSSGLSLPDVPYFDLNGQILWGATAMIMNEFLELLHGNKP